MPTLPPELSSRQEIWRGLLYGQRSVLIRLTAELKVHHGLTVSQYEALLELWEAEDHTLRASALSQQLLYSSGSASHLIARLEDLGLVTRVTHADDARVVEVRLTAEGLNRVAAATAEHLTSIDREFGSAVEDSEVEPLLNFVRRLATREGVSTRPARDPAQSTGNPDGPAAQA